MVVVDVVEGSPAAKGGLKSCDLIETVGGRRVDNPSEVQLAVDQSKVGDGLELEVRRGERQLKLQLRPAELPRQD